MGSFGDLQILKISMCNKLTNIFSLSSGKCLEQLRELEVESCESMEAIVGDGIEDVHHNIEMMEFTHLSSLKLKSLPRLKGFCKLDEGTEQIGLLFCTMVSFPSLTSLEVNSCLEMKHIFAASMVKSLMQLKNLKIEHCELVEEIIESKKMEEIEEDATDKIVFPELDSLSLADLKNLKRFSRFYLIQFPLLRELRMECCYAMGNFVGSKCEEYLFNELVTFSNLETMHIRGMNSFKYLWDEQFVADDSFHKLKFISILECSRLSVVFPSTICARFHGVESLTISRCERVEEIYQGVNLKDINSSFSLRRLSTRSLPSLKHLWNEGSEWAGAFFTFQNLQSVEVDSCDVLEYVFPASVGYGLLQLQCIHLRFCNQLEVMIAKEKDVETSDLSFQFPELTVLQLMGLRRMSILRTFNCPKLKSLEIVQCLYITVDKFVPILEELEIDERAFLTMHRSTEVSAESYTKLKKVILRDFYDETFIPFVMGFFRGLRSLETLVFESCWLEEILGLEDALNQRPFGEQQSGLRVKHLQLSSVLKLKHITKIASQHLQTLKISLCNDLMNIAPSSISLQNLTTLHVSSCGYVKNLVTSSTAKTMTNLIEMKVSSCWEIEEIVAKEEDSTEHDMIIFSKLKFLELKMLPNFNSFCSVMHCFSFPLLEQVTINICPKMNSFCRGTLSTPQLRGILFEDENRWEGNLNDTISSQTREWVCQHLEEGRVFRNLVSLELVNNSFSSKAISANQMQFLNKLCYFRVRDCDSIQVVFDLEEDITLLPPKLKVLELTNLPMLTQLCNKSPRGILDLNRLRRLRIEKCSRLVYAFTWPVASCLCQLQSVTLKNCEMMETLIVDEEEHVAQNAILSSLENVVLENMPKFSSIYSGRFELECPSLKSITTLECPSFQASTST